MMILVFRPVSDRNTKYEPPHSAVGLDQHQLVSHVTLYQLFFELLNQAESSSEAWGRVILKGILPVVVAIVVFAIAVVAIVVVWLLFASRQVRISHDLETLKTRIAQALTFK